MAVQIVGLGKSISVTTSAASIPLPTLANGSVATHVILSNSFSQTAFFKFGKSNVVADLTTNPFVPLGTIGMLFNCAGSTHISALTASSTSVLTLTPVEV